MASPRGSYRNADPAPGEGDRHPAERRRGGEGRHHPSMLRRYHIIDLDDLRRAGKRASDYRGPAANIVPLTERDGSPSSAWATVPEPSRWTVDSRVGGGRTLPVTSTRVGRARRPDLVEGRMLLVELATAIAFLVAGVWRLSDSDVPPRSVAVGLVPPLLAETRVHADVLEIESEKGPLGQCAGVEELAALKQGLCAQSPGVGGLGHLLRADQYLVPTEVALELGPEPPAGR